MSTLAVNNKEILRLAIPSMLANITVPLVGLVDMVIVGHLTDAAAIAGIAIGSVMFDFLYWNFAFLRAGTGGMTAQAFGRNSKEDAINILAQGIVFAVLGAILVWLIQWPFAELFLSLQDCSQGAKDFARAYFYTRIWAAPATLSAFAFKGWFIGMQNTRFPMYCDLVVNGVNILACYLLCFHTSHGPIGVAYGAIIAQYTGLLLSVGLLLNKYSDMLPYIRLREALRWNGLRKLFSLNANLFVRSLCFMGVYVGYTSLFALYGDTQLALSGFMMRLFMLFSYMVDGFAYAGEALSGRFIGEGEDVRNRIRRLTRLTLGWGNMVVILVLLFILVFRQQIMGWLTTDANVLSAYSDVQVWLFLMPILSVIPFLMDGIFIGATEGKVLRNSMIYAIVFFAVTYAIGFHWMGVQAIYLAYMMHFVGRALCFFIAYPHLLKRVDILRAGE